MVPTRSASDWSRYPALSSGRKAPEVCAFSPAMIGNSANHAKPSMVDTLPRFMAYR